MTSRRIVSKRFIYTTCFSHFLNLQSCNFAEGRERSKSETTQYLFTVFQVCLSDDRTKCECQLFLFLLSNLLNYISSTLLKIKKLNLSSFFRFPFQNPGMLRKKKSVQLLYSFLLKKIYLQNVNHFVFLNSSVQIYL